MRTFEPDATPSTAICPGADPVRVLSVLVRIDATRSERSDRVRSHPVERRVVHPAPQNAIGTRSSWRERPRAVEVVAAQPGKSRGVERLAPDAPPDELDHERRAAHRRSSPPPAGRRSGSRSEAVVSHDARDRRRDAVDADPVRELAGVDAVAEEHDRDVVRGPRRSGDRGQTTPASSESLTPASSPPSRPVSAPAGTRPRSGPAGRREAGRTEPPPRPVPPGRSSRRRRTR